MSSYKWEKKLVCNIKGWSLKWWAASTATAGTLNNKVVLRRWLSISKHTMIISCLHNVFSSHTRHGCDMIRTKPGQLKHVFTFASLSAPELAQIDTWAERWKQRRWRSTIAQRQDRPRETHVCDVEHVMLGVWCWVSDVGCVMGGVWCWVCDVGCVILSVCYWVCDVGCVMWGVWCWVCDFECVMWGVWCGGCDVEYRV